jgi:choline dehydrogenase-like flavoprotein
VQRVIKEGNTATGVEFIHRGALKQAFASKIILAAGGMGTPKVLRQTGIENVGADFFFDPLIFVMGEVDGLNGGKEFPMAAGFHFEEDGFMLTDLVLTRALFWMFTSQVFRFGRLPAHKRILPIMVKIKDELGGHITQYGEVRKRLGDVERKRLMGGYEVSKRILENAGARNIFKTWYLAVHPGGTAKIDEAVDSNLKTEIDNLYVCDSSVIPEAWGLPPVLTILALGKRLGKHLAG